MRNPSVNVSIPVIIYEAMQEISFRDGVSLSSVGASIIESHFKRKGIKGGEINRKSTLKGEGK